MLLPPCLCDQRKSKPYTLVWSQAQIRLENRINYSPNRNAIESKDKY